MDYRKEIDGLRAVAVVPVVLFHGGIYPFSGGYVGVDVFFVISGYLITTILMNDLRADKFSLVHFYERRARRILPALFTVAVSAAVAAWLILLPSDLNDFFQSLFAVATFSANVFFWMESGYFDTTADLKPLLHTWSLAVEEQYYVFFPVVLMLVWRFGRRWVSAFLVVGCVISLAVAQVLISVVPDFAFYMLPTRAWELFVGSIAALLITHETVLPRAPWIKHAASLLGLAMIGFAIFVFDDNTPFPGVYALVPTVGTALIILFAVEGTAVKWLLGLRPFVWIGLISYSAYLWHQPLFAFARYYSIQNYFAEVPPWVMMVLGVASFALAYVSWRFIEQPARNKALFSRKQIFAYGGATVVLLCGFSVLVLMLNGVPGRQVVQRYQVFDYQPDNLKLRMDSYSILRGLADDPSYEVEHNAYDKVDWFQNSNKTHRVLVIGNSHGKDVFNVLHASRALNEIADVARYGTQIRDLRPKFFKLPNYQKADVILIAARYSKNDLLNFDWFIERVLADGKKIGITKNIYPYPTMHNMTYADMLIRSALDDGSTDVRAIQARVNSAYYQHMITEKRGVVYETGDQRVAALKKKFAQLVVLDRVDFMCDRTQSSCLAVDERLNKSFYDYGHHTLKGAQVFADRMDAIGWLTPLIDASAGMRAAQGADKGSPL